MEPRLIGLVLGVLLANPVCAGSVSYTYDELGRLVELLYEDGSRVTYTYDDVGNRITEQHLVPASESCNLDVDGNGSADALSDGLLTIRYEFGFGGAPLIEGAVGSGCSRCTAADIEAYLAQCGSSGVIDIDGNNNVEALADGLLTIRYEFGFTGAPLIEGAVGSGCSRCTAPEIEAYLEGLLP